MNVFPVYYDVKQMEEAQDFIREEFGSETDKEIICHEKTSEYVHTDIQVMAGEDEVSFVTFGVGARKMNSPLPDRKRIELVMFASSELCEDGAQKKRFMRACAELVSISKYPFENNTWLGHGHTINASDEFAEEYGYEYFLFIETPETAKISGIGDVHFLIAIPVFEEERDWMASHDNGSLRFFPHYIYEFHKNGNLEDAFKIDVERNIIIPPENEE